MEVTDVLSIEDNNAGGFYLEGSGYSDYVSALVLFTTSLT